MPLAVMVFLLCSLLLTACGASPTATSIPLRVSTAAPGAKSQAPVARAMAEDFVQAAIAGDLTKAVSLFPLDRRSKLQDWHAVIEDDSQSWCVYLRPGDANCKKYQPTLAGCKGVRYDVVERIETLGSSSGAKYTFVFSNPCAVGYTNAHFESVMSSQLYVSLTMATGNWALDSVQLDMYATTGKANAPQSQPSPPPTTPLPSSAVAATAAANNRQVESSLIGTWKAQSGGISLNVQNNPDPALANRDFILLVIEFGADGYIRFPGTPLSPQFFFLDKSQNRNTILFNLPETNGSRGYEIDYTLSGNTVVLKNRDGGEPTSYKR